MGEVSPDDAGGTKLILYTCPTGGWVMGNRHAMEEAIKAEIPGCQVQHKFAYPFTAVAEIDGKKGKREIGPFLFCCPGPVSNACCSASKTGKNAKELAGGAPPTAELMR